MVGLSVCSGWYHLFIVPITVSESIEVFAFSSTINDPHPSHKSTTGIFI